MTTVSMTPLLRRSVGFDRFNDLFESAFNSETAQGKYPPYNIEKTGDNSYAIIVAAAGFSEADLDIETEGDRLSVTGNSADNDEDDAGGRVYLHKGIAARSFRLHFSLADYIEVEGAELKNGLLTVKLKRIVPESAQPRKITIGNA